MEADRARPQHCAETVLRVGPHVVLPTAPSETEAFGARLDRQGSGAPEMARLNELRCPPCLEELARCVLTIPDDPGLPHRSARRLRWARTYEATPIGKSRRDDEHDRGGTERRVSLQARRKVSADPSVLALVHSAGALLRARCRSGQPRGRRRRSSGPVSSHLFPTRVARRRRGRWCSRRRAHLQTSYAQQLVPDEEEPRTLTAP